MTRTLVIATVILATLLSAGTDSATAKEVVVLELFQSQGCSSCPPANANANALSARDDILVLSFGVTYWDQLGWRDTFAKPEFTQRQYDYAAGLRHSGVYTPQIVLNGRSHLPGIDRRELEAAIANAGRVPTAPLALAGGVLSVQAGPTPRVPADVWLVRYDPRTVEVPIQAGENGGRTLPHRNIVRELVHLGRWTGEARSMRLAPSGAGLRTAVLIQQQHGGPILAALAL